MIIRPEKLEDIEEIKRITEAAFRNHPYSHQTEHLIVKELRDSGNLVLSLVAELGGAVVGHIAFSKVLIDKEDQAWYGIGPLSVDPEFQQRGIGSELVLAGIEEMRGRGANGIVLVGDPAYYQRFGFQQGKKLTFRSVPPENFLVLSFLPDEPHGEVSFHDSLSG